MEETYSELLGSLASAERAIVGIFMHAPESMDEVDLSDRDFSNPHLGALYAVLREAYSDSGTTDPVTAHTYARRRSQDVPALRHVTAVDISDIYGEAPAVVLANHYGKIVREAAGRRRLIEACARGDQLARGGGDFDDVVETIRGEVDRASRSIAQEWSMGEAFDSFVGKLGEPVTQHPTMWPALNDVIGGYRSGALYTIGARPGTGKSIFAVQAALDLCEQGRVVWCSMEMGEREVFTRLTSNVARINSRRLDGSAGGMRPEDWEMVRMHQETIRGLPLTLSTRRQTMSQIRSTVRTASRQGKLAGVIVDQLGNIEAPPWARSEYERITYHTDQLKALATEFDIPVIVMSQLNRETEKQSSDLPMLANLRSSGSIEQDSDVVIFLFNSEERGFGIYVPKNRQGPKDVIVPLVRRGEFSRLENPSFRQPEADWGGEDN